MPTNRKIAANKRNASLSTGPRTVGGKRRSRNNALRHGLARPIDNDPTTAQGIEQLIQVLAGRNNDGVRGEPARAIAECYFDMRRIQAARTAALCSIGQLDVADAAAQAIAIEAVAKINRYEQRVLSRRRKALRGLSK